MVNMRKEIIVYIFNIYGKCMEVGCPGGGGVRGREKGGQGKRNEEENGDSGKHNDGVMVNVWRAEKARFPARRPKAKEKGRHSD